MQVNLNCQTPNKPNFGMAIHSNENVNKVLKSRIKTTEHLEKLNHLIDQANKNDKVDIRLFVMPDRQSLSGNVYTVNNDNNNYFLKSYRENWFDKLSKNPVKFIQRLVNIADKKASKLENVDKKTADEIFSKME